MKEEIIGKVKLNYSWYSGEDLYSDGDAVENRILEIVRNEEGYEFALDEYTSWPILYHLTRQRENIVLPMEIGKGRRMKSLRSAREWALSQERWRGRRKRSTA